MDQEIHWKQRLKNYNKALAALKTTIDRTASRELTDPEKQEMIQGFEAAFKLAWDVIKDFFEEQGITGIAGSKGVVRRALNEGLINSGQFWLDMIKYHDPDVPHEVNNDLFNAIVHNYYPEFSALAKKMNRLG